MHSGSSRKTLALAGTYTIDRASELSGMLLQALSEADSVDLDLSGVVEFDLSALQILYGAAISARHKRGALRCTGTVSATLCARLESAGFSIPGPLSGEEFMKNLPEFGMVSP
jgi:ABC-type transporter Mla MlaB component